MKVIAFKVKPDSELYRGWFAARQEKERFQNLAREFMERHFGGPKNYVITGKLTVELTEEEPDFPPVSDVADLGKSEGEIARNIAVNIRLFEGWDE